MDKFDYENSILQEFVVYMFTSDSTSFMTVVGMTLRGPKRLDDAQS